MKSPTEIINATPRSSRESETGYMVRLIKTATREALRSAYDRCSTIAYSATANTKTEAEQNIALDIGAAITKERDVRLLNAH